MLTKQWETCLDFKMVFPVTQKPMLGVLLVNLSSPSPTAEYLVPWVYMQNSEEEIIMKKVKVA